jgi:hypothetical protein
MPVIGILSEARVPLVLAGRKNINADRRNNADPPRPGQRKETWQPYQDARSSKPFGDAQLSIGQH